MGFDRFHTHFDRPSPDEYFPEALAYVDAIMQEQVVVVVSQRGEQWAGSTAVEPAELPAEISTMHEGYSISWRGTYDHKVVPPPSPDA